METEVETIIAQLCGCIDTGTLSKYGKNSRVEDVEKRQNKKWSPQKTPFFIFNISFLQFFNQFLSGKMYAALYGAQVESKFICNFLILVTAVVHLERDSEFRFQ